MPGTKPCEIGCTCGHHPEGKLPPEQWTERQRSRERARVRHPRTPEQQRRYLLKAQHGMTPGDWDAMWSAQRGRCCYCERSLPVDRKQVHIDHDHSCCPPKRSCVLCRRGLACAVCNLIVGYADDDADRLEVITRNLARFKGAVWQYPRDYDADTMAGM